MNEVTNLPQRDPVLWNMAQKRVSFKRHLTTYILVNGFLWALWLFGNSNSGDLFPWPVWSTAGWGVGLFSHFLSAYGYGANSVEKEYEKLKSKNN
jgi:hypothetical protein